MKKRKKGTQTIMKNKELINTINILKEASRKSGKGIWRALAEELDRSKRRRVAVNLSRINRNSREGNIIAVPGKVLASGQIEHTVTVAAYDFSEMAVKKIEMANGKVLKLTQLLEGAFEPSNIKIIK